MYGPIYLVIVLAAIVYGSRHGLPLGAGLLLGSLVLLLTMGFGVEASLTVMVRAMREPATVSLVLVVLGIAHMGMVMSKSGAFTNLLDDARALIGRPTVLMTGIPALLSMLTIPGGAIMSASMVDELGDELGMTAVEKTTCNILFRHLWYFVYMVHPMYAMIETVSGVPLFRLFLLGLGPAVLAWVTAYKTCVRVTKSIQPSSGHRFLAARRLIYSALPILVVAVGRGILRFDFISTVAVALLVASLYGARGLDLNGVLRHAYGQLAKRPDFILGLASLGVMVFQIILVETGVTESVAQVITSYNIPLPLAAFLVPLALGLTSGSTLAAVGMSLPLFVGLVPAAVLDRYVVFIYISSLSAYVISPLHLCLVLSCEFFGVDQLQVARKALPTLVVLVGAAALLLLI